MKRKNAGRIVERKKQKMVRDIVRGVISESLKSDDRHWSEKAVDSLDGIPTYFRGFVFMGYLSLEAHEKNCQHAVCADKHENIVACSFWDRGEISSSVTDAANSVRRVAESGNEFDVSDLYWQLKAIPAILHDGYAALASDDIFVMITLLGATDSASFEVNRFADLVLKFSMSKYEELTGANFVINAVSGTEGQGFTRLDR